MQQQQQQRQQRPRGQKSRESSPGARALCLDCLKKTSVRGLPRILTAKSLCLRLLWTVAVVAFFGLLLYNVVKLTLVYIRGDVILSFEPWIPRPAFPSVTVCDASPLSYLAMRRFNLTPRAYSRRLLGMAASARQPVSREIVAQLLSPMAYHDHLGAAEFHAALREDPLVLAESCSVQLLRDGVLVGGPCERVEKVQVPGYFSCSTLTVADSAEHVTFHVVLDSEVDSLECSKCIPDRAETLNTGVIMFLHEPGTFPVSIGDGLRVMPGTQNFVLVKTTRATQRRFCSDAPPDGLEFRHSGREVSSRYTYGLCEMLHRHDLYQTLCNCSVSSLPHSVEDDSRAESSLPLCHQQRMLHSGSLSHLDRVECVLQVDGRMPVPAGDRDRFRRQEATRDCPVPCSKVSFSVARSQTKGIDRNSALDIFERYLLNTSMYSHLEDRLSVYAEALSLRDAGLTREASLLLGNTSYLEDNFMTVTLHFNSNQATVESENLILGLSAFISQIGGLLALFSGITVVCAAELAELFWLLVLHWRRWLVRCCHGGAGARAVDGQSEGPEAVPMLTI